MEVTHITAHTGHELGTSELAFLPLPKGTKEAISAWESEWKELWMVSGCVFNNYKG